MKYYYILLFTTIVSGFILLGGNTREINTIYSTLASDDFQFKFVFNSLPLLSGWFQIVFLISATISIVSFLLSVIFSNALNIHRIHLFSGYLCILISTVIIMSTAWPYDPWSLDISGFTGMWVDSDQIDCVGSSYMWIQRKQGYALFYTTKITSNSPWPDIKYAKLLTNCWGLKSIGKPPGLDSSISSFVTRLTMSQLSIWRTLGLTISIAGVFLYMILVHTDSNQNHPVSGQTNDSQELVELDTNSPSGYVHPENGHSEDGQSIINPV